MNENVRQKWVLSFGLLIFYFYFQKYAQIERRDYNIILKFELVLYFKFEVRISKLSISIFFSNRLKLEELQTLDYRTVPKLSIFYINEFIFLVHE